jgi:hypothetical protein
MDHDKKDKDPEVGIKVLLFYFKTVALHVMLAGAVAAVIGIFTGTLSESYSLTWVVQLIILFNIPLFKKLGRK